MTTSPSSFPSSLPVPSNPPTHLTPSYYPFRPPRHEKDPSDSVSLCCRPIHRGRHSSPGRIQTYPQVSAHGGGHPGDRLPFSQQSPSHLSSRGGGGGETSLSPPPFHPLPAPFWILLLPKQLPVQGQLSAGLPLPLTQRVTPHPRPPLLLSFSSHPPCNERPLGPARPHRWQ